jgi:hypothetical protein
MLIVDPLTGQQTIPVRTSEAFVQNHKNTKMHNFDSKISVVLKNAYEYRILGRISLMYLKSFHGRWVENGESHSIMTLQTGFCMQPLIRELTLLTPPMYTVTVRAKKQWAGLFVPAPGLFM